VDMELNEEQSLLQSTARRFLARSCTLSAVRELENSEEGFSREMWADMAGLGWLGLVDLCVLQREMGRALVPGPYVQSVVLCAEVIALAGSESQKASCLGAIARGERLLSLVMGTTGTCYEQSAVSVSAERTASGAFLLCGVASFV